MDKHYHYQLLIWNSFGSAHHVQNFDLLPKEITFARIFSEVEIWLFVLTNLLGPPSRQVFKNQFFKNLIFSSPVKAVPAGSAQFHKLAPQLQST